MVLATDNGTTNTRAFLFDEEARMVSSGSSPTLTSCPGPAMVEQDAQGWWDALTRAFSSLREKQGEFSVRAISSSAQGGTFVPLSASLQPLRPGVTWLDGRAASFVRPLNSRFGRDSFFRRTGHYPGPWAPPVFFRWLARNEPACLASTARVSFVSDYLNYCLTGRFFLDHTAAGMTMLYDPRKGSWDEDLIEVAGLKGVALPDIVPAGKPGGRLKREAAARLGLPAGTPVISGGHDQYCASLGSGAARPGDCLVSCGTAWVLLACVDRPFFVPGSSWSPGRHLFENSWGMMSAMGEGGAVLDWVRKNFRVTEPGISPDSSGGKEKLVFTTGLNRGRGAVRNISFNTDGAAVYRAALESLAGSLCSRLDKFPGKMPVGRLFLAGGGSREPLLAPLLRRMTGREIIVTGVDEAAARGAALLALGRRAPGEVPGCPA